MKPGRPTTPEDRDIVRHRRRWPTAKARWAADRAVDKLSGKASMDEHVDTWIAAYRAAGGEERKYDD